MTSKHSKNKTTRLLTAAIASIGASSSFSADHIVSGNAKNHEPGRTTCSKVISANDNKVEIINCGDIDLKLETRNGSKIEIESNGTDNKVVVKSSPDGNTSITQSGNGNSVVVTQSSSNSSTDHQSLEKQMLRMKKLHERHLEIRRKHQLRKHRQ